MRRLVLVVVLLDPTFARADAGVVAVRRDPLEARAEEELDAVSGSGYIERGALIEVEGLTKRFGGVIASDNIVLDVKPRELHAVIGPNGAGKTTLFNCVSGLIPPDGGRVLFDGVDVTGWSPDRITGRGLVRTFQIARGFSRLSVLENVLVPVLARQGRTGIPFHAMERETRAVAEARRILGEIGLAGHERLAAGALSHGDQRLLELGIAIAPAPELCFLDEPSSGLTPTERSTVLELIRRTAREFAEGEVAPVAEQLDREKRFPYEVVAKLGELGFMGIPFPEEYGGAGADSLAYALVVEELTRVDSSVAITMCAHTSLGTQPIYLFGSEEHKRDWLPELTAGRKLGAFGLTEPEAGSDAGNVRTRAKLEDGEWVINGAKQFITNSGTYTVIIDKPDVDPAVIGSLTLGGDSGIQTLSVGNVVLTLNGDSVVNVNDLLVLLAFWGPVAPAFPAPDINDDGMVNVDDLQAVQNNWGNYGKADVTHDGVVNDDDQLMVINGWSSVALPMSPVECPQAADRGWLALRGLILIRSK